MISIAVCDDERIHAAHTRDVIIDRCGSCSPQVRVFTSAESLLDEIKLNNYAPEIAVLDIQMANTNGIELAARLNELLPQCAVIYLTSFLEYATDVYETRHIYFILKNELEQRINEAINKAIEQSNSCRCLVISNTSGSKKIPLHDILYFERSLHKTIIQTKSGQEVVSATPAELLKDLPENAFIRCHQSYWVSYRHIVKMSKNEFVMTDDKRIPISRTYRNAAKEMFFDSIREQ